MLKDRSLFGLKIVILKRLQSRSFLVTNRQSHNISLNCLIGTRFC